MFNDHVGIFTGIEFDHFKWSYRTNRNSFGYRSGNISLNFLSIPLYLRIVTSKLGQVGWFFNPGLKVSLLMSVKERYADAGLGSSTEKTGYTKTNFAPFFHTGICLPILTRVDINVGPYFQYQILGQVKDGRIYGQLTEIDLRVTANVRLTK